MQYSTVSFSVSHYWTDDRSMLVVCLFVSCETGNITKNNHASVDLMTCVGLYKTKKLN